jgi:isopentenyl diphosphate isomerase/L-lactate dehydrogenase-like FMN-dependent dehydrogenase
VDTVAGRAAIAVDVGFTRGAAGVACSLDILRPELRTTMVLAGQTSVKNLDRDLVLRVD